MINRITVTAAAAMFAFAALAPHTAHAIDARYRAKLERSGCTQVTEANGTCDPNKTKAQNTGGWLPNLKGRASEDAYAALARSGWESTAPLTFEKNGHRVILTMRGDTIINAETVR